jgi:predicted RecB family nuclease
MPERMQVISPRRGFEPETFRTNDYLAYYRYVCRSLTQAVGPIGGSEVPTYPEPVEHCQVCRWWQVCDDRRRSDDHLSLVAGISTLQRRELETHGVTTLVGLARLPLPLARPRRGSREALERVREQARVQLEGRVQGTPVHELLDREPGHGLGLLPEPSPGDVFFDLEGDAFVGDAGMEYLFGYAILEDGEPAYHARWALTPAEERTAFEAFVDMVIERWEQYPDLHIYHYAAYEPAALRRLMGRYSTREAEVDRMLRAGLFVDLYAVVRRSVRASVEHYSIKDLEVFYGYARAVPLREASLHVRTVEWALELGQADDLPPEVRATVETYNRDDCVSTFHLREWLEMLRAELVAGGEEIARPELSAGDPSEKVDARRVRVQTLKAELAGDVSVDRAARTDEEHARWLLAEMLEWHRREQKVIFWEYYRLRELPAEELFFERSTP